MGTTTRTVRQLVGAAALAGAVLALAPSVALASGCQGETHSRPFAGFHDRQFYFLVPDGGLTHGTGAWQLKGGAQVHSDPLSPTGMAVYIPSGGSATTPGFCVSGHAPTARAFGLTIPPTTGQHGAGHGGGGASLEVSIVYRSGRAKSVGNLSRLRSWSPTRKFSLASGRLHLHRGAAWIRYRFTAVRQAAWEIDDVYVDPRMR